MAYRKTRSPLFPFVDPKCDYMQRSVVALIHSRDFSFALPPLTQRAWPMLCDDLDRERLEFLGDALIGSAISEILFHCRPNEGPGFYTNARMVLVANSTFAHLMQKVGLFELCGTVKKAGDAFETVMAAFHHEFGPQAFQTYLRKSFSPLIDSVGSACDRYQSNDRWLRARNPQLLKKPCRRDHDRHVKKANKQYPKNAMTLRSPRKRTPVRFPVFIDLTAERFICNAPQASSSKGMTQQTSFAPDPARTIINQDTSKALETRAIPGTTFASGSSASRQLPSRNQLPISLSTSLNYCGPTDIQDQFVLRFEPGSILGNSIENPITID